MKEWIASHVYQLLVEISALDTDLILLTILLVMTVIVIDGISAFASMQRRESGFTPDMAALGIDGSKFLPGRTYVSDIQGLAGRPDALVVEDGFVIPVERKPLAKKMHDRYVAQILVYMRLIEEIDGKRPPHGYLILGPKCRRFKIDNTDQRQAWLQVYLDEMRGILDGTPAKPAPHPRKCRKCDVRNSCAHRAEGSDVVQIGALRSAS